MIAWAMLRSPVLFHRSADAIERLITLRVPLNPLQSFPKDPALKRP